MALTSDLQQQQQMSPKSSITSSSSVSGSETSCSPRTKSPENVNNTVVSSEKSENPVENVSKEENLEVERDTKEEEEDDDQSSKILAHLKPSPIVRVMESHHQQTTNSDSSIVNPLMAEAWENLKKSVVMFNGIAVGTFAALDHSEISSECNSPRTVIPSPKSKEVKSPENVDTTTVVSSERSENPVEYVSEEEKIEVERDTKEEEEEADDDQSSKILAHLKPSPSVPVMESHHQQTTNSDSSTVNPLMVEAWENLKKSVVMFSGIPVGTLAALDHSVEALNYNQMVENSKKEEEFSIVRPGEEYWRVVHQFNSVNRDILKLKPNNPLQTFDLVESVLKIRLTEDTTQVIPLLKCFRKVCNLWKQVVESEVVLRSSYYWSCGRSNRVAKENWGVWRENFTLSADIAEAFKMLSTYHSTFSNFRSGCNTYSSRFWRGPSGYHCSSIASQQSEIICGFSNGSLVYFHVGKKRICRDSTFQPYLTDGKLGSSAVIGIVFEGNKEVVYGETDGYIISLDLNSSEESRRIIYGMGEEGTLIGFEGNHQGWVALYSSGKCRVWSNGMVIYTGEGYDFQKVRVSAKYCLMCARDRVISFPLINPGGNKIFLSRVFFLPNTFDANDTEFVVVDGNDALVVSIEDFSVVQRFLSSGEDLNMGSVNSHFWLLTYFHGRMTCLGLRESSRMRVMPEAAQNIVALKADETKIVAVSDGLIHLWHM